jgi:hypothetical protein
MGHEGVYSSTTEYIKKENCSVCSIKVNEIKIDKFILLKDFLKSVIMQYSMKDPSVYCGRNIIYITKPEELREVNAYKLERNMMYLFYYFKKFRSLANDKIIKLNHYLLIVDEDSTKTLKLKIIFNN